MSTIWTPGGEYVPKPPPAEEPPPAAAADAGAAGEPPSPEQIEAALAEARAVLSIPVVDHIASQAMSLFELAALQLERPAATGGAEAPDLAEASLAIDAMAALVEGLGDRLGKYAPSLTDALAHLRMAFVRVSNPE
ncbi:MAG TPA: hypothetical protein VI854_05090 [Acidimicrobiia bacterium]|nr:hypothetical protein [Acidimicrobiia bacterium]